MKSLLLIGVAVPAALATIPALAADPANGKGLAERWCSSCHVVSSEQRQASADVPSFSAIARQPGFDAGRLALFLLDPHPKMPSMSLTRAEAADIAEYVKALGR
jgi:mono/diheme cytochrome c family protein